MTERPRSRQTVLVGWLTVALIVLLATVILLIQSPWNDRAPHPRPAPTPVPATATPH